MKNLYKILYGSCMLLGVALLSGGCSKEMAWDETGIRTEKPDLQASAATQFPGVGIPGVSYVKLERAALERLHKVAFSEGAISMSRIPSELSISLNKVGAKTMKPLFPTDPRYVERHRAAGLDLWYEIHFDQNKELNTCLATLAANDAFEIVEKVYPTETYALSEHQDPIAALSSVKNLEELKKIVKQESGYDDPELYKQWHYKNYGAFGNSQEGSDAGIFEAWKKVKWNNKNVIVSIVDGGVQVDHEDLKDNMWVNTKEIAGNGKDDDNNGYVDDINGFNFCSGFYGGKITFDSDGHGTHVAGTVAARNNNGIGVCGVAGGDHKQPGTGAKLMSCQIFAQTETRDAGGNSAAAIVYGADNGAVISQNSWGYRYEAQVTAIPSSLKTAIDYFIQNAGCDKNGNQRPDSPMKGGVVIFAAGNDGKDYESFPAAYPPTIAVSSMTDRWQKASYTNRGAWVDIMAPGGDYTHQYSTVYSTVPPEARQINKERGPGAKYHGMAGTSMACPHVSGIAALIVAHYGKQGFTNKDLEKRLLGALKPDKNIDELNPGFEGRLGMGIIDAGHIFDENQNKKPHDISYFEGEVGFVELSISWKTVSDDDDYTPSVYNLYLSEKEITETDIPMFQIKGFAKPAGMLLKHRFEELKENTTYYVGIQAVDRWGLKSKMAVKTFTTKKNNPPLIGNIPQKLRISTNNTYRFELTLTDPDGHKMYASVNEQQGVFAEQSENKVKFTIRGGIAPIGKHELVVTVTDEIGGKTMLKIPFEVYKYVNPSLAKPIEQHILALNDGAKQLDLTKHFNYDPQDDVKFEVISGDANVVKAELDKKSGLTLTPVKMGKTTISLTLNAGAGDPVKTSFVVYVVPNKNQPVYLVYPLPVQTELNLILNPEMGKTEISLRNMQGQRLYNKIHAVGPSGFVKINMKKFAPGSYTLQVKGSKGSYSKTFVKI